MEQEMLDHEPEGVLVADEPLWDILVVTWQC